jgi:hypothetical protein
MTDDDEQMSMDLDDGPVRPSGPWMAHCGNPGPYAIRRPTPKNIGRLEVLICTRPHGHQDQLHMYAEPDGRIIAAWYRDGRPHWPGLLKGTE